MLPEKQDNLDVKIICSAIPEAVIIKAEIIESVSNLFRCDVFLQTSKQIDIEKVVNSTATVSLFIDQNTTRYFSGIVEEASFENLPSTIVTKSENILYIKIVPTLALLTYSKKYRSFQELSAKDIIQNVLKENGISNVKMNVTSSGTEKRTFCVQYGESDFHFVSRLMEEEGIFYYFKHESGKDTVVISDSSATSEKTKLPLRIRKSATNADLTPDSVFNVSFSNSMGSKKIDCFSYNETNANIIKGTSEDSSDKTKVGNKEFYDALFFEKTAGDKLSKTLLEADNSVIKKLTGASYAPELYSGCIFQIDGSSTKSHNGEFFLVSIKHSINQLPTEVDTPIYQNSFIAIPSKTSFRPSQNHFKNRIVGCQTATVTGSANEEIFCDENARIKVKFHWDSRTQKDDKSSCWIRIAQTWAGSKFGSLVIPRVGMEVLVDFINGDPDQPLVTGCVYNGVNKPPSDYPKEKNTVSTFYTNSSKGQGFNELRFNDKAKEEEIFIHAQKDMNSVIEDSVTETLNIGSKTITLESRDKPVVNSLTVKKGDNKITLNEGNFTIVLDKGNQSITLTEGNQKITLTKGNQQITLTEGNQETTLTKGNQTITLKDGNQTITLSKGNLTLDVTGNISVKASQNISIEAGGSISVKATKDFSLNAMKNSMKADTSFELSGMTIKAQAQTNLDISGTIVKVAAQAALNISAMAAATISSSAMMTISGSAGVSLSGAMIKLN